MKVFTRNSIYEINFDRKLIRRIGGTQPPTSRFTPDGEWKPYMEVHGVESSSINPTVVWPDGKYTLLSPVVTVMPQLPLENSEVDHHTEESTPIEIVEALS